MRRSVLGLAFLVLAACSQSPPAVAQSQMRVCIPIVNTTTGFLSCQDVTGANPLPITGSFSATTTGFTPALTGTPISVTTGGVTGTLPVAQPVVVAFNTGATNTAFCKLGASATTSDIAIPPASWFAYTVGVATQLTCITSTSTTTVNMVGGSGLPTGAGGGGGGTGSSAITTWAGGTLGAMANYGSSPGAVLVPGVNAFVTNSNTNDAKSIANSSPVTAATINVGPTDCSSTVVTGGTAVNAITAGATLHGAMIQNIDTTEGMWISLTGTAAASTAGSYFLQPGSTTVQGGTYTTPLGFGFNTNLSVVAATNGHKFTCTKW